MLQVHIAVPLRFQLLVLMPVLGQCFLLACDVLLLWNMQVSNPHHQPYSGQGILGWWSMLAGLSRWLCLGRRCNVLGLGGGCSWQGG